jgi:hypothetical protein
MPSEVCPPKRSHSDSMTMLPSLQSPSTDAGLCWGKSPGVHLTHELDLEICGVHLHELWPLKYDEIRALMKYELTEIRAWMKYELTVRSPCIA